MNSRIRGEEQVFCLLRSGEHYDNVQCRVGIHCTLSNRLRSLPGLLSRSCGVRNKQAQVENSSSLSVLSVTPPPHPPILFVFVHPPSVVYRSTIQRSCRFCSWLEKKKKKNSTFIRHRNTIGSNFIVCGYTLYVSMAYARSSSQSREQEFVDSVNYIDPS